MRHRVCTFATGPPPSNVADQTFTTDGLKATVRASRWFDLRATQEYYPLVHTAFWVEHRLWGDAPFGYHMVDVLLHVADASLAYLVLRRLRIPGAALAAPIYSLHPVHVESVAWIVELKNTFSESQQRLDDAEAAYREAIRFGPRFAEPHNNLAIVLYARGDYAGPWREHAIFRSLGGSPDPDFVLALSARSAPR